MLYILAWICIGLIITLWIYKLSKDKGDIWDMQEWIVYTIFSGCIVWPITLYFILKYLEDNYKTFTREREWFWKE